MRGQFYTYVHLRKTDGKVFYVGKGQGSRAFFMHNRNAHWGRVVAKHGIEVVIVAHFVPAKTEGRRVSHREAAERSACGIRDGAFLSLRAAQSDPTARRK